MQHVHKQNGNQSQHVSSKHEIQGWPKDKWPQCCHTIESGGGHVNDSLVLDIKT